MPTDEVQQADAVRYVVYTLATMSFVLVLAFLYLFNFTSFFKLAAPL